MVDDRLRQIFVENTSATPEQIDRAAQIAERTGESLGSALQMLGAVTEEERLHCLALKLNLVYVDLRATPPPAEVLHLVKREVLLRYRAVPVRVEITLALPNPLDVMSPELAEEIAAAVGCPIHAVVGSESQISAVLKALEEEAAATEPSPEAPAPAIEPEAPPEPEPEPVEDVEPEIVDALVESDDEGEEVVEAIVAEEPVEDVPEAAPEAEPQPAAPEEAAPEGEPAPSDEHEDEEEEDLSALEQLSPHDAKLLEALLLDTPVPRQAIEAAIREGQERQTDLGHSLVRMGSIAERDRVRAEGRLWGIEFWDLTTFQPDPEIVRIVGIDQLSRYGVLPIRLEDTTLYVAAVNPLDINALDSLRVTTGYQVHAYIAVEADIRRILGAFGAG